MPAEKLRNDRIPKKQFPREYRNPDDYRPGNCLKIVVASTNTGPRIQRVMLMSSNDIFHIIRWENYDSYRKTIESVTLEAVDESGNNMLHVAASRGKIDIGSDLIERGIFLNRQGKEGKTPLHYALEMGDNEMATLLISAGADVTVTDDYGNQPLWSAVMNEEVDDDVIRLLVQHGADPVNQNEAGKSPLDVARRREAETLIELFTH
ncbi:ankyrin repeat domain-containing protein [Halogeometricum borinquense]|uniref:ankyrin repeat domain-containing protein n=1 Tax=Halogeometricum borinquense TaxID=60847 RepID=UPI00342B18BB